MGSERLRFTLTAADANAVDWAAAERFIHDFRVDDGDIERTVVLWTEWLGVEAPSGEHEVAIAALEPWVDGQPVPLTEPARAVMRLDLALLRRWLGGEPPRTGPSSEVTFRREGSGYAFTVIQTARGWLLIDEPIGVLRRLHECGLLHGIPGLTVARRKRSAVARLFSR